MQPVSKTELATRPLQDSVLGHLPVAATALIFLITGSVINRSPTLSETVAVGLDFDCFRLNPNISNKSTSFVNNSLPSADLHAMTIAFATLLPLLPLAVNSRTSWNEEKTAALVSHVLGQTTTFGSSEFIRRFTVFPDQTFGTKCNLSSTDCYSLSAQVLPLHGGLCQNKTDDSEIKDIFYSFHSMPDLTASIVGASCVIFFANLFLWRDFNKSGKDQTSAHHLTKLFLIVVFVIFVAFAIIYRYNQLEHTSADLALSFVYGAILQSVLTLLYQIKSGQIVNNPNIVI